MKTAKNKFAAGVLCALGYISMLITSDATAFIFLGVVAIGLWFEKENVIK